MSHVIAIANQKGGVGKTTTAINLGASLAVAEKRTLVVDVDPQGNATSGLGVEGRESLTTVYDVLVGDRSVDESILHGVHFPYLDVVPSTRDLVGAEIELVNAQQRSRFDTNGQARFFVLNLFWELVSQYGRGIGRAVEFDMRIEEKKLIDESLGSIENIAFFLAQFEKSIQHVGYGFFFEKVA